MKILTIFLLSLMISTSFALTLLTRNRVHVHLKQCDTVKSMNDDYLFWDSDCWDRVARRGGGLAEHDECMADELGVSSMDEWRAKYKEAEESCTSRRR